MSTGKNSTPSDIGLSFPATRRQAATIAYMCIRTGPFRLLTSREGAREVLGARTRLDGRSAARGGESGVMRPEGVSSRHQGRPAPGTPPGSRAQAPGPL